MCIEFNFNLSFLVHIFFSLFILSMWAVFLIASSMVIKLQFNFLYLFMAFYLVNFNKIERSNNNKIPLVSTDSAILPLIWKMYEKKNENWTWNSKRWNETCEWKIGNLFIFLWKHIQKIGAQYHLVYGWRDCPNTNQIYFCNFNMIL